ncbi:hypothetical protein [Bradyrhizobium sp. McL0615]|uniref:hypothetical protein n=1 Tax=Bradyrhizobium sp. McL0615 TaxID=3415673 RepID=UPI003CEF34B5
MSTARKNAAQLVHYLRFAINWNDAGIAAGVNKQTLPAGAILIGTDVLVVTPFNAGTTNDVTVGIGGVANNVVTTADAVETAAGLTQNIKPSGIAAVPLVADSVVKATFTQTGGAATAGKAIVIIKYVPDNDL